jgi:hypothetical protein
VSYPYLVLHCVPATDGIAQAPCGTVDGVALIPAALPPQPVQLDTSHANALFAWGLSVVMMTFVVGLVVGAIQRVIRSA